jgi:hypothetical protein
VLHSLAPFVAFAAPPLGLRESSATARAQVRFDQVAVSFVLRNLFSIILLAGAFASTVVAGAFLSARFVTRSIERVTRLALAIDPRAPQTSR